MASEAERDEAERERLAEKMQRTVALPIRMEYVTLTERGFGFCFTRPPVRGCLRCGWRVEAIEVESDGLCAACFMVGMDQGAG